MSPLWEVLNEASMHCDILERLRLVPAHAKSRGVFFRSIELAMEGAGHTARYRELLPARHSTVRWYPLTEFLEHLVVAGTLLAGPERVHQGMFQIGRANARVFTDSLLGRLLVRQLSRDPRIVMQQALVGHRQSNNVSRWELTILGERHAEMQMYDEYFYIESYVLGAAYGTFEMIDVPITIESELYGPLRGRFDLKW